MEKSFQMPVVIISVGFISFDEQQQQQLQQQNGSLWQKCFHWTRLCKRRLTFFKFADKTRIGFRRKKNNILALRARCAYLFHT